MIGIIYFIKCNKNSKLLYIGSTIRTIKERYIFHYYNYKKRIYTFSLTKYFDKYGIKSFYIEKYKEYKIIDKKHLLALEQLAINKFKNKIVNKNNPFGLQKLKPNDYKIIYRKKLYNKHKDKITYKKRLDYFLNKDKYKQRYKNNINYYKQYKIKHKDKIQEYSKEYRLNYKEYYKQYGKEYRLKNNKELKIKQKEYYEKNKDKIKEYYIKNKEANTDKEQLKFKQKEYNEKKKDKIKKMNKEYYEKNKEKLNLYYLKNKEENKDKYKCECCNYITHSTGNFNIHLKSNKHIKNRNV